MTFKLYNKDWTKQQLKNEIDRLHRRDMNESLKFHNVLAYAFDELMEAMTSEGINPGDVWACRDWWNMHVKSKSITLHLAFKKEMQLTSDWRFRKRPLFINTDEEMEAEYYPRGKKPILKFNFKTGEFTTVLKDR